MGLLSTTVRGPIYKTNPAAILLYCCIAILLHCYTAVLLYYLLHCCIPILLYCCTAVLLYCYIAILLYCCIITLLYCCIGIMLHCCIPILLHCYIAILLYCLLLHCCIDILLYCCIALLIYRYIAVLLYCYIAILLCCYIATLPCCYIATFVLIYRPLKVYNRTRWLYLNSVDTLKILRVQQIGHGMQLTTYFDPLPKCASIPSYAFLVDHRDTRRCRSTGLRWVWTLMLAVQKHTVDLCWTAVCFSIQSGRFTNQQSALYRETSVVSTRTCFG